MKKKQIKLRAINNILTAIVVVLGLYIFATPFMPRADLYIAKALDSTSGYIYESRLAPPADNLKKPPGDNRLILPTVLVNEQILEGSSIQTIGKGGLWRRPQTAQPGEIGNTVIIGHRFAYNNASTLYNLDKINIGDPIIIFWNGREINYRVNQIKVVPASEVSIEQQTKQELLTLYTCTPLWSSKDRLVVIAEPIEPTL